MSGNSKSFFLGSWVELSIRPQFHLQNSVRTLEFIATAYENRRNRNHSSFYMSMGSRSYSTFKDCVTDSRKRAKTLVTSRTTDYVVIVLKGFPGEDKPVDRLISITAKDNATWVECKELISSEVIKRWEPPNPVPAKPVR